MPTTENGKPKFTNRLADERSPYLQQHAHNPVDWFPWGNEAFERANQEQKPVFLSVGYSTCHWCHVMERESFDNEEIADFLNIHFVSIKLDREERPDLDEIYMTGLQLMTGQGGWPMSSFITPDGQPFYAGTYFPPADFMQVLKQISTVWKERHDEVIEQAAQIADSIARYSDAQAEAQTLDQPLAPAAAATLLSRFDEINGGFGSAPKFPNESQLLLLLDDMDRRGDDRVREALKLTLDQMAGGGIFDQIAGGFHRYSVDAAWRVPHFEKMLYNQSQLIRVYAKAAQLMADPAHLRIVTQTANYLFRDMQAPDGLFYAATDADSEGVEGKFFVWQPDELEVCLAADDWALVRTLYQVTQAGDLEGASILHREVSLEVFAEQQGMETSGLIKRLDNIHQQLYAEREKRVHPLRDDKRITAWNAMVVTALVQADLSSGEREFGETASRAAEALWSKHFDQARGSLWRVSVESDLTIPGQLEDYGYFAEACFQLYLLTAESKWQSRGNTLIDTMLEKFWDDNDYGFFVSQVEIEGPMIARSKSATDGAMPSGNSAALMAMVMAYEAGGQLQMETRINQMIGRLSGLLQETPSAYGFMVTGLNRFLFGSREAVQWGAGGKLHIAASIRDGKAVLRCTLAPGWHINSDQPNVDLIATEVTCGSRVHFPLPAELQTAFSSEPLGVFEGAFEITVDDPKDVLEFRFQACDRSVCLKPEIHVLRLTAS